MANSSYILLLASMSQIICFVSLFFQIVSLVGISAKSATPPAERLSIKKCNEYKEIYREHFESPLPPPFDEVQLGDLKCPKFTEPFIFGGRDAYLDEFPHMASLQYKLKNGQFHHGCGGTLISEQYILTAAHCINAEVSPGERLSPAKVILGDISIGKMRSPSRRKELRVDSIVVHPNYKPNKNSYHDIALIKLAEKLTFGYDSRPAIRPACLALPQQKFSSQKVTATGWGRTNNYNSEGHSLLQAVNMTMTSSEVCGNMYSETVADFRYRFPDGIIPELLCAGERNKDTCQGDSGGPLTINPLQNLSCMDFVIGITSVGPSNCGSGIPAIYTRVEKYLDWIEDNVWRSR